MKIRYYIKSFKNVKGIENFERGGYIYIEHHKIYKFETVNSLVNNSGNVLFEFELLKTSKASELYKISKIKYELRIITEQSEIPKTIYLKPNIFELCKLYINNRKTTNWIKNKIGKYTEYIIIGIISSLITLSFSYRNNRVKNEENIETIKRSIKREILLELKDSYLESKTIFIKDSTEINKK